MGSNSSINQSSLPAASPATDAASDSDTPWEEFYPEDRPRIAINLRSPRNSFFSKAEQHKSDHAEMQAFLNDFDGLNECSFCSEVTLEHTPCCNAFLCEDCVENRQKGRPTCILCHAEPGEVGCVHWLTTL